MKRTISLIIAVVVMISMLIVSVNAAEPTSPMYYGISLADVTSPVDVVSLNEIVEGESVLQADISGDKTIKSGNYIIDLNGYTWTGRLVIEGGNVTIKDTSAEKTGKIDASQINDAIDISGGAIVDLQDITIIGAFGSGDGIFVTGSPNVTVKNCVITAGKAGIDVVSLSAVVIVEDTLFADFANFVPEKPKDARNAAVEFRNNAKVILRGNNEFEVNTIICRTATHEISFEESFVLGDNAEATFTEDVDLGMHSEHSYKSSTISYVYDETEDIPTDNVIDNPADETTNEPVNQPEEEQEVEFAGEKTETLNPNTDDFMPFIIVVTAIVFVVTVLSRKKAL